MAYTLGDIGNVPGQAYDFLKRQAGRFVNLTKPGADDDDYATRSAAIARQRKLADMLSQMGEQEQAVSTAGGITAPMSGMGALARGLTSFGGAYLSGKASADEAAVTKAEKAAIQRGFADIFEKGDLVEQGAQLADDAEGIPQYAANTQVGGGKYILTPEAQQRRLIELVGKHPGAVGQANLYSNLIGDEIKRAEGERERKRPQFKSVGEGDTLGTIDPDTGVFTPTGERPEPPPYLGTGESSQDYNILLKGDPSSPVYLAAWNRQSTPRMSLDSATGQVVYQTPNMSAFRPPSGRSTDGGNAPGQGVGGPDQRPPGITFAPIPGATPPTSEGERKAATLLGSLRWSQAQLVAATNESPDAASPTVLGSIAGSINPTLGNAAITDQRQRVESAQLDILDAALTLRTGAAYTREQLEGLRTSYFPQLLDKPGNIKDKKDRLDNLIRQAEIAAGRSAPQGQAPGLSNLDDNTPPLSVLAEGQNTTFGNGQVWTLRDGIAVKVK